jgi:hypothetical protein
LVATVGVVLLGACTGFGAPPKLEVKWTAGKTFKYHVHAVVNGTLATAAGSLPVHADQRVDEVVSVDSVDHGAGSLTITQTDADGKTLAYKMRVGGDGRILSGGQSTASRNLPTIPELDQPVPVLPGRPINPGDKWTTSYTRPNPLADGSVTQELAGAYLREERLGATDVAVIENKVAGQLDFSLDVWRLTGSPGVSTAPAGGQVAYRGTVNSTDTYWLEKSGSRVVKVTRKGHHSIAYDFSALQQQGTGVGIDKLQFDGDVTIEQVAS